MQLGNRTAIVTGGASGIGAETVSKIRGMDQESGAATFAVADVSDESVPKTVETMIEGTPLGLADPVDIARAIAFLASDDAAFLTGTALPVDGGDTAQ